MGDRRFEALNEERDPAYRKDERNEDFLSSFNRYLYDREKEEYLDRPLEAPVVFVVGAPRSGTTLLTQCIAHSLDLGYIDNLAARFFMAPLHGMRFSKAVLGREKRTDFSSDHASTQELGDVHEFGYFWRKWMKKERFEDVTHAKEREDRIDWKGVRSVLASMQREAGRGMVFKNILGGYHMERFQKECRKVLFVHIVRDEMDAALSILNARKKYHKDPRTWWSYLPLEHESLHGRDPYEQIAGQVHCLKRFYREEMRRLPEEAHLELDLASLCSDPRSSILQVQERAQRVGGTEVPMVRELPESFPLRSYEGMDEDRSRFEEAFRTIRREFPA